MLGTSLTTSYFRGFPKYIDRHLILDLRSMLRPPAFARLIRSVSTSKYDLVIDFEQWSRILPILFAMAGIPFRLGFRTNHQYRHFLLTDTVRHDSSLHELENFGSLVRSLDADAEHEGFEVQVDPGALSEIRHDLAAGGWREGQPVVVMHPACGAHGFPREWPPQRFAELASRLRARQDDFFVLTGTTSELAVMGKVEHAMEKTPFRFVIDEPRRLVALLSLTSLFVSGNNGVMHLAAALSVPQVALHGPTDPRRWGPRSPRAVVVQSRCPECPCLNLGFEYHRTDGYCMSQISVEDVYRESIKLMSPTL
jgi:ADP-heptose:LPS heptosyltransferase